MKTEKLTFWMKILPLFLLLCINENVWAATYYAKLEISNLPTSPTGIGSVYVVDQNGSTSGSGYAYAFDNSANISFYMALNEEIKVEEDWHLLYFQKSGTTNKNRANYNEKKYFQTSITTSSRDRNSPVTETWNAVWGKLAVEQDSLTFSNCDGETTQTINLDCVNLTVNNTITVNNPEGNNGLFSATKVGNTIEVTFNNSGKAIAGKKDATIVLTANEKDWQSKDITKTIKLATKDCEQVFTWKGLDSDHPKENILRQGNTLEDIVSVNSGLPITLDIYSTTYGGIVTKILADDKWNVKANKIDGVTTTQTVVLKASVAAQDGYAAAEDYFTLSISDKAPQTIIWPSEAALQWLTVGDNNTTVLDAYASCATGLTPGNISYEIISGNDKVHISGNALIADAKGEAVIKATASESADCVETSIIRRIVVNPKSVCKSQIKSWTDPKTCTYTGYEQSKPDIEYAEFTYENDENKDYPSKKMTFTLGTMQTGSKVVVEGCSSSESSQTVTLGNFTISGQHEVEVSSTMRYFKFHVEPSSLSGSATCEVSGVSLTYPVLLSSTANNTTQDFNLDIYEDGQDNIGNFVVNYSNQPSLIVSCNNPNVQIISPSDGVIGMGMCGTDGSFTVRYKVLPRNEEVIDESAVITVKNADADAPEDETERAANTITVNVNINVSVGDPYYFVGTTDSDWDKPANWRVGSQSGTVATTIPTQSNPVFICSEADLSSKKDSYSLNMETGGKLTIASSGGLSVHSKTISSTSESNLVLAASKEFGTGYLRAFNGTASPKATVQMYSKAYYNQTATDATANDAAFQYIGCPINAIQTTAEHLFYKCWLYRWDNTANDWTSTGNSYQMKPFEGYAFTQPHSADGMTISYAGNLYPFETTSVSVDRDNTSESDFFCVANSFAAPIDISKFKLTDFVNLESEIYIFNTGSYNAYGCIYGEGGSTNEDIFTPGQYITVPVGSASAFGELPLVIPSMQGFFVKMLEGKTYGSLVLNYDSLVWNGGKAKSNLPMFAQSRRKAAAAVTEEDLASRVLMTVNGANRYDYLCLLESDHFTKDYDNGYDGRKEMGSTGNHQIYTNESAGQLMVSATNELPGTMIGFAAPSITRNDQPFDTTLTYTVAFFNTLGAEYYLHDNVTGEEVAMVAGNTFTFTAVSNTKNDARFTIMREPKTTTSISDLTASDSDIRLWTANDNLYVSVPDDAYRTLRIFDMQGHQIIEQNFRGAFMSSLSMLPQGVYMATIGDQTLKFSK